MMTQTAVPIYFGPPNRRLFGWYHPVPAGTSSRGAVVLCKPIGYEAVCVHATYRYLAERLATAGYAALRFDYDGTGDSAGMDEDPDRVSSWLASIGHAIDALKAHTDQDVLLFGVRMGATLATLAAARRTDVAGLILWAAFRNGKSYLREFRALSTAAPEGDVEPPMFEEAAGFLLTPQTMAELSELDIQKLSCAPAPFALLIGRDDFPTDTRLGNSIRALGTIITEVTWPGYAGMMQDPQDVEIPIVFVDALLDWLTDNISIRPRSHPTAFPEQAHLADESYTEEAFVRDPSIGFGILTRPRVENARSRTAVLLLTVGANPHLGPNRMYVSLARMLAPLGFPVVRLDIPGVGDNAAGPTSGRSQIYSREAVDEALHTLTSLRNHYGIERFILIGLCSGAYAAYQTAVSEVDIAAQILINVQIYELKNGESPDLEIRAGYNKRTAVYLGKAFKPSTLLLLLKRQVDLGGAVSALGKRFATYGMTLLKNIFSLLRHGHPYETLVCHNFRKIAARGSKTLFVFSSEDVGIEVMTAHLGTEARKIGKNCEVQIIAGADHIFTRKAPREQMIAEIVSYLERSFIAEEKQGTCQYEFPLDIRKPVPKDALEAVS